MLRQICKIALLGQRNLVNVVKSGIELALKLIETHEIKHSSGNKVSLVFRHSIFCSIFASLLFFVYFNCKFFFVDP
jgi:hypothetical protein